MSKYGEIIDSSINLNKINVYNFFVNYFNNPILIKIKEVDGMAMFGVRIKTALLRDRKYIFALVPLNDPSSRLHQASLSELNWDFIQTRNLSDVYNVPTHSYFVQKEYENIEIRMNGKNEAKMMFYYSCNALPINITLLGTKNQSRIYSERGTLNLAIENYNTIVNII
jgi:hypothetical protein